MTEYFGDMNEMRRIFEAKAFLIMRSFDTISKYEGLPSASFWDFVTERGRILDNFKRGKLRHHKKIKERLLGSIFPSDVLSVIVSFSYPSSLISTKRSGDIDPMAILPVPSPIPSVPGCIGGGVPKKYDVLERGKIIPKNTVDTNIYKFYPVYPTQRNTFVNIWVKIRAKAA